MIDLLWIIATLLGIIMIYIALKNISESLIYQKHLKLVFVKITVPKKAQDAKEIKEEKSYQDIIAPMDQFFTAISKIIKYRKWYGKFFGQDVFIFELVGYKHELHLFALVDKKNFLILEKQITSFYPDATCTIVEPFNFFYENSYQEIAYLTLSKEYYLPLRTYKKLDSDPFNSIVNVFSKLNYDEGASIQIIISTADKKWSDQARKKAAMLFENKSKSSWSKPAVFISNIFHTLFFGYEKTKEKEGKRLTPLEEEKIKLIEEKAQKVEFHTTIRLIVSSPQKDIAKAHLENMIAAFNQYGANNMNSFKAIKPKNEKMKKNILKGYIMRSIDIGSKPMILNTEELASIFHIPDSRFNKATVIAWQKFRLQPPPNDLPQEGVIIGYTQYRNENKIVRIAPKDRFRHMYWLGSTGTGKSVLLNLMIMQDIYNGKGVCLLDPHGEEVDKILQYIPKHRAQDVILFDAADYERPLGINIMEAHTNEEKNFVVEEMVYMFEGMFGHEIFGPRIQDYFRNAAFALLDDEEDPGTIIDVVRIFTDMNWQYQKIKKIQNPTVLDWWKNTYAQMGDREKAEIIPYFAAKFGQFITNNAIRNIVGQNKSSFDFFEATQTNKIILCKLAKGLIGEKNMSLLGRIITTKIQLAAMKKAKLEESERKEFYLYMDEMQNFISPSIESILSEARKYKLAFHGTHQYMKQLEKQGGIGEGKISLKEAILGNVGNILTYKVGPEDAEQLVKVFAPLYTENDFQFLGFQQALMRLSIDNNMSPGFNIQVFKYFDKQMMEKYAPKELQDIYNNRNPKLSKLIIELSRLKYGKPRELVEKEIFFRQGILGMLDEIQENRKTISK